MAAKHIRVVAAVVKHEDLYLITQRRTEAVLGGLWEFPGGKVEPGESDEQALSREFYGRLGANIVVGEKLAERMNEYADYDVTLALYACDLPFGQHLRGQRVADFRWVRSADLDQYPFPAADQKTMDALLGLNRQ